MGEGAAPVAVAQRPDASHVGAQLVIDLDVAAGISPDPGAVESQIVRVGPPSDRQEQVRPSDLGSPLGAIEPHDDIAVPFRDADTFRVQAEIDALAGQERRKCR